MRKVRERMPPASEPSGVKQVAFPKASRFDFKQTHDKTDHLGRYFSDIWIFIGFLKEGCIEEQQNLAGFIPDPLVASILYYLSFFGF